MEQDNRQQHSRKRKRTQHNKRLPVLVIAAVLVFYIGAQVISAFWGSVETVTAAHVTVDDSFGANGWFIRDEVEVSGSASETVKHIVYSGERVQQNAPLAIEYSDEQSLTHSRELEALDEQIALLDTALQTAGDGSDAAKLDQLITLSMQQLSAQLKTGSGATLSSAAASLRTLSLRREAGTLDAATISAERQTLDTQRQSLSQQLSGRTSEITAPSSGYFSEIIDGYEEIFTLDALEDLTLDEFQKLTSAKPKNSSAALGKIIQGFSWYLGAEIPTEQANRLSVGTDLRIRFTQASIEVPVTVYALDKPRNSDVSLVILEGNEFNSEIVSMRDQPIDIILGTYTGLKVPKEAARMETDSKGNSTLGVYILSGSMSRFKSIKPLYETDQFYVVQQSATDVGALVAQDKIIIKGKDIQNNRVVKT